ncbi:hypothetical protein [Flagellimonas abyssi]|uniref:TIGR02646 family protein n=1 Tax=Flagellimonas abyssi TaxID=2864871 RepID=A0ABS7EMT1_9FLAO|nr:hypothetical protein [Allomuricauda abyssi]MBW8198898.1 hypothetical protein [Allomuricauda abyssi]
MIKINRDNFPPSDRYKVGANKGSEKWRVAENKVLLDYKADSDPFEDGSYKFPSHPSSAKWKEELIKVQGAKCCYCEKPLNTGALEHFRPKKAWQDFKGGNMNRPGYYWLTYRWKNLFLSCSDCNESSTKGNLFPISGTRAFTPKCNLALENNNLINPYEEDPSVSISFYKSLPYSKDTKGKLMIDMLNLRSRGDLASIREDKFVAFQSLKEILDYYYTGHIPLNISKVRRLEAIIARSKKSKQPFSGMIIENIKNGIV